MSRPKTGNSSFQALHTDMARASPPFGSRRRRRAPYGNVMTKNSALAFLFSCALCACSSSSGDSTENTADGAACPNLAGNWTVSTHCDMSLVGQTATVTQTNCSLSFAPPFDGFTGSVTSAGQITLAGPQSCTGTAAMSALSLSCTPGTCTVSLTRR